MKIIQCLKEAIAPLYLSQRASDIPASTLKANNPAWDLDVKPDNIFINYQDDPKTVISDVALGDFGDTFQVDPSASPYEEGHIIGAGIFRSPEAMLNLRWGPPTDIWSFGATVSLKDSSHR